MQIVKVNKMCINLVILLIVLVSGQSEPINANKTFDFINGRIVGGSEAVKNSAPWVVSLQYGFDVLAHACGGSIIAPNWVLTAGHCLVDVPKSGNYEVLAGKHDLETVESTEQRRTINRDKTWVHPQYPSGVAPYDLALIFLREPFTINTFVNVIPLPVKDVQFTGQVTLYGWGSTSKTIFPSMPNLLQTVNKPIISYAQCKAAIDLYPEENKLHETNVCTGPLTGGISACSGDSGSAIVKDNQLVGIASWTILPCGLENAPTVYVQASPFVDWINKTIETNGSSQMSVGFWVFAIAMVMMAKESFQL